MAVAFIHLKIASRGLCLAGALALLALTGCGTVGVEQQRMVSQPSMQFSRKAVFSYSSRIMPQVLPGLAVSGGAQPSTCTVCR